MREPDYMISRSTPRFSFIAEAEVTWPKDKTKIVARVSELSALGCYVDTVNPFPMDAQLQFRIRYGCSTCELSGKVIYTHSGYGMGVVFGEIDASHRAVLKSWLDELARKSH